MSAQSIPADWDSDDPTTWTFSTTVDACLGVHHTGGIMREYRTITHRASDYEAPGDIIGDESPGDAAAWWADVLGAIHDAEVAIAEATPAQLDAAMRTLGLHPTDRTATPWDAGSGDDLEADAATARRIVAALAGSPDA